MSTAHDGNFTSFSFFNYEVEVCRENKIEKEKLIKRLYNGGGRRISGLVLIVTINTNSPYPLGQTN